jgi:hypothetical protein
VFIHPNFHGVCPPAVPPVGLSIDSVDPGDPVVGLAGVSSGVIGVTAKFMRTKLPGAMRTRRDWLFRSINLVFSAIL